MPRREANTEGPIGAHDDFDTLADLRAAEDELDGAALADHTPRGTVWIRTGNGVFHVEVGSEAHLAALAIGGLPVSGVRSDVVRVEQDSDLSTMTVEGLREVARELEVPYSGLNKDDLVAAIEAAQDA